MSSRGIAASIPLTSSGAVAETQWTFPIGIASTPRSEAPTFEIARDRLVKHRHRAGEAGIRRHARTHLREHLVPRYRKIGTEDLSVRPATSDSRTWRVVGPGQHEVDRIDIVGQAIAPVEGQQIGERTGRNGAALVLVGDGEATGRGRGLQHLFPRDGLLEAGARIDRDVQVLRGEITFLCAR
jgi:hypothetical protein